jgi:hypothetical protein
MGKAIEHAKSHAMGRSTKSEFESSLSACIYCLYSWRLPPDGYPSDNPRWLKVAEAFRHACILHTTRMLDVSQPAQAPIIQKSVTAVLDAVAEIPSDCQLIELLVMPLFMAGVDALSSYARHYILLRFDHVRNHGGLCNQVPISLLKSVWDGREKQLKHDSSNVYWAWFVSFFIPSDSFSLITDLPRPNIQDANPSMIISLYDHSCVGLDCLLIC